MAVRSCLALLVVALPACRTTSSSAPNPSGESAELQPAEGGAIVVERIALLDGGPPATVWLAYRPGVAARLSAILMLGALDPDALPEWSPALLNEGFMLAAFSVDHPPDPDPARRPEWLCFDERFAHGYALMGARAPQDAARVIDYLLSRGDVNPQKIGWLGSSSTGIAGLAVAVQEKRLSAIVAFVSTGAYAEWFATWRPNGLWRGGAGGLWPETTALLAQHDPIRRAADLYPCAALLVCGAEDHVVDPASTRAFVAAARPGYADAPERLRLVLYEGFGHNLPPDVVRLYIEHWFRLYLDPVREPPPAAETPAGRAEAVRRTQINAADHRATIGAPE